MPTAVSETDTFPATLQRPNNGELADAASIAQFADGFGKRTRYTYNRSRGNLFDITRAPYSADPTGVANSTAGIQAAIDAAAAAGGGDVFFPPGIYLRTLLNKPSNVNLWGIPGATFLNLNHATQNNLTCGSGSGDEDPSVVYGINFIGNVANSGINIFNNSGARVYFEKCAWNGLVSGVPSANLQGKICRIQTAGSWVILVDCRVAVAGDVNGFDITSGALCILGGTVLMPAVYSSALVYADTDARIEVAARLDCTGHTSNPSGHGKGVYVVSSSAMLDLHDAEIDATGSPVLADGVGWVSGARIDVANLRTLGNVDRFFINSTALLGSNIELLPSVALDFATAGTITIPRGYRSVVAKSTVSANVEWPTGLYPGQELLLTLYNADSSAHNMTPATTPLTGTTVPNPVIAGDTLTGLFVWESRDASGAYRWVQKGAWGTGLTLV